MEETKNWKKKTESLIRQDKGGGKKEKKKKGRKTDNTHFKQGQIIFQRIKERKRERRTASHEIIVSLTIPKELDKIRFGKILLLLLVFSRDGAEVEARCNVKFGLVSPRPDFPMENKVRGPTVSVTRLVSLNWRPRLKAARREEARNRPRRKCHYAKYV